MAAKIKAAKRESCVQFLSDEEGRGIFERAARQHLKMSGAEFMRAWNAGEFEDLDAPEVQRVAMLLPLAR